MQEFSLYKIQFIYKCIYVYTLGCMDFEKKTIFEINFFLHIHTRTYEMYLQIM